MSFRATALAALFFVVGCRETAPTSSSTSPATSVASSPATRLAVTVDEDGYHPASVQAPAGSSITLAFTRTSDEGCGQQLVFPDLGIRRDLPLNQPVEVSVTTPASGRLAFTCGMGMMRGSVVVD